VRAGQPGQFVSESREAPVSLMRAVEDPIADNFRVGERTGRPVA
jgi:hypothetical protein